MNLWNSTQTSSANTVTDAPVLVIEGPTDTSIELVGGQETNKIYLRWAEVGDETEGDETDAGALEVFQRDVSQSVQTAIRDRYVMQFNSTGTTTATIASGYIGKLVYGETELEIHANVASGNPVIKLQDNHVGQNITITVGGEALGNTTGTLEWLGGTSESTSSGVAEATDVILASTNLGTKEVDIMSYAGVIIKDPKANAAKDIVEISVPKDQVYGKVSVTIGGTPTQGEAGVIPVKDDEASKMSGRNLIVVGGSAINSVAAELLNGNYAGEAFTAKTGVGAGEFMIESFNRGGKIALLVAGYNAADTEKAVQYLNNVGSIDTTVGKKYKGNTAIEAVPVVA
jgi:hypothetical protein